MVFDLESGVPTRLTFEPSEDWGPVWTPDGSRIVFSSDRDGAPNLYSRRADGGGGVERLTESAAAQDAYAFTPGGELLFTQDGDVWMLPLGSGTQARRITESPYDESYPTLSPDGRYLAVQSDEAGPREVFVYSFPDMTGQRLVSTLDIAPDSRSVNADLRDAWSPVWSKTGNELYYQSGPSTLIRVPLGTAGAFTHGNPEVLMEAAIRLWAGGPHFDVTRDGDRLLVIEAVPGGRRRNELIVAQNWLSALESSRN